MQQWKGKSKPTSSSAKARPAEITQPQKVLAVRVTNEPLPVVFASPLQQREEEIHRLKDLVQLLEENLRNVGLVHGQSDKTRLELERRVRSLESNNSVLDLDNAQLKMKLN